MPETESKNSRPVVFSFDCNTEFHFIEQKKQQFLYFAGVIATIIFLVFKVEINFSLHPFFKTFRYTSHPGHAPAAHSFRTGNS